MFGIGMPELIIILVIIMIIFGAGKLPEIGAGIGKGIREFKDATKNEGKLEKEKNAEQLEEKKESE
ncbi:MAG: twin-arginine translocase TatA/TatE family subunit [Desulfatibacillaceae bacterium]